MLVLYAEDDIDDFDIFCKVLKSFDPSSACINTRNGQETLEFLDKALDLPDIIFLDINMPAMDGKVCIKNLKRDDRFKTIPIVIYTTSQNQKDREHCLQLGAVDFVRKPNTVKEAQTILAKFFKIS